jgi:hypothetical protein
MAYLLAIGIGAGLVSALLFGVVITGSPLGVLLLMVIPLPIFIAALGWTHLTGLVAALAGGLALALAVNRTAGLIFGLGFALPAWWLAYLALLGRPGRDGGVEWYPLGRLLLWIAATAALITLVGILAIGDGSYEAFQGRLRGAIGEFLRAAQPAPPAGEAAPNEALAFLVAALPFFFALNYVLILALNLWLAGHSVRLSGRLPRGWPDIPATTMPPLALALLAAGTVLAFLPGLAGGAGLVTAGALLAAFTLQGLAFIHDTTRQRPGRGLLLGSLYVVTLLVSQVVLPLLAVLGCADVAFGLRNRFRAGPAGPRPPST